MLPKDSVSLQAYLVIHPHADLRVICLHGQAEHQGHWCRWYWGCMTLLSVLSLVKVAVHGFVLLKTVSFSVTAALIVTIDFFFCVQYQREFPLYHHVFNVSHSRGLFKNRSAVKATQAWHTINRGAPECHTVQRHVSAAGQMSSIFEIVLGELRACILSHSTRDRQQDVGGLCLTPLPSLKIVCGRKKDTKNASGFLVCKFTKNS